MSRISLESPSDHRRGRVPVSTILILLAVVAAVLAVTVGRGFNGMSLVAVMLVVAALVRRAYEGGK